MDLNDEYVYQPLDGDGGSEGFVVRRSELLTREARRGAFCLNIPFKNSRSRSGDLALRIPLDAGRAGTARLRREIELYSHLQACPEDDRHGLGVAVGADLHSATNIVIRWYRATAPLGDPKWRSLTRADRYELGVHMLSAVVSLGRVGLVHQDICPDNLVLRYEPAEDGDRPSVRLWLVDFGHAFRLGDAAGPPIAESAAHPDWAHPDRLDGSPANVFTDLWECVLTWLDVWSGANQRSATDGLGMTLPFDLPRDLTDTIRAALAAARAGDATAPTEILFAMERAFHQELRKDSIRAEIEQQAPRTRFDLLELTTAALEERFESEYRLQVRKRARSAESQLKSCLADATSRRQRWWRRYSRRQDVDELVVTRTVEELSRGNTLQVSTVIEPELRRSLVVIDGFTSASAKSIRIGDPGAVKLFLVVLGVVALAVIVVTLRPV